MSDARAPAQREVEVLRELLEEALLDRMRFAGRIRSHALAGVDDAVRAASALVTADANDPRRVEKLDRAVAAAESAAVAIRGWSGSGGRAADAVAAAARTLAAERSRVIDHALAIEAEPTDPAERASEARGEPPFRASVGLPALHRRGRAPLDLVRVVASAEVIPDAAEREAPRPDQIVALAVELQASGDEDDAPDSDAAPRERSSREPLRGLRRLARAALEQIGALGELRSARLGERWTPSLLVFEERLMASMDALAALGTPFEEVREGAWETTALDVATEAVDYLADAFTIDPMRAFACAFALGSIEGEDAARAAVLGLVRSHRETHAAQAEALSLAPSPAVGRALERVALRGRPDLARIALSILRARNEAPFGACAVLLQHPDAGVREAAARCMGRSPQRGPAIAALAPAAEDDASVPVAAAAVESLLILDTPLGLEIARARLGAVDLDPREAAPWLRLVGIAGGAEDLAALARASLTGPAAVAALGWLGHTGAVEPLIDTLAQAEARVDLALAEASDRALRRILGDVEEGAPADRARDAATWRARWLAIARDLPERKKVRRGELFTPRASFDELEHEDVPVEVREACALEIGVLSGGGWIDVHGWIARQRAQIRTLDARFRAAESSPGARLHAPGEWVADRLGRRRV